MPSYFNRRTIGSSDSSRRRIPPGHRNIGVPVQFTLVDASQHRGKDQQDWHQCCQPSAIPQEFMGYGHDPTCGSVPPPPGYIHDNSGFQCPRCGHPFTSQAELDHHSVICAAAALLTGMFTPYSAQQNDQRRLPQWHVQAPAPHGAGGYHRNI